MRTVRTATTTLTLAGLALALSACTSSAKLTAAAATAAASSPASAADSPTAASTAAGGGSPMTDGSYEVSNDVGPTDVVPRQIISTATMTVETTDVPAAVTKAMRIAITLGGRVDSQRNAKNSDGIHEASVVLKVPPTHYREAINQLSALGDQRILDESTDDVTGKVADLESRAETDRKSIERIRAFMDKATTIKDLVILESELTARQSSMESQLAQAKALRGQAAMGTIKVTFIEKGVLAPEPPKPAPVHHTGFVAGLNSGWHAFSAAVVAVLTAVGALAPFTIPVLLVLGGWLVVRRRRRALTPPAPSEPETA